MDNYIGEIKIFAGYYVPQGWHLCDGTLLKISDYDALYSLLGDAYGGDGITTFALPNLKGKVPVGIGQLTGGSTYALAQTGGAETVTLTTMTIPSHNHAMYASTSDANTGIPNDAILAKGNGSDYPDVKFYIPLPPEASQPNATLNTATLHNMGAGTPHNNLMPYVTVNYIIALNGIYPAQQ